ncbi:MAG: CBS domain-containing protein [Carbonactinosporaceae bacterium]
MTWEGVLMPPERPEVQPKVPDQVGPHDERHVGDIDRVTVAQVMSSPPVVVQVRDSLWSALERFRVSGLRHLVVVEENGHCLGVVADRHMAAEWVLDPLGLHSRQVRDIVRDRHPAVMASCLVREAAAAMLRYRVDALPVVDAQGTVTGIVTSTDLVGLIAGWHDPVLSRPHPGGRAEPSP